MDAVNIFYRSLRIVASDLDCELIPVHNYWAGYLEEQNLSSKDLVLSDSRYPNERGHQVIAEAVMKWLGNVFDHHRFLLERNKSSTILKM
jgi:lysophospholipase L1-like esterase